MTQVRTAVVVGNPRPRSRTRAAAHDLAARLTGREPDLVVDLADVGPALLQLGHPEVADLVARVVEADLLVVASPTYKGTYTGLLKLFLDQVPTGGLHGVVALPLMLGAGPGHASAPEQLLRPVLTELGACVPVRGLYLLEQAYDDPEASAEWRGLARPVLPRLGLVADAVGAAR